MCIAIAAILTMAALGLLFAVWLPCMQIASEPATMLCALSVILVAAVTWGGVRAARKSEKPVYLYCAVVLFLLSAAAALFRAEIADGYRAVFTAIRSGASLPM